MNSQEMIVNVDNGSLGARSLPNNRPIKIAYIRPPRHFWPIINESDNFLLPLGYPALAGYLREHMQNIEQVILDCCVVKMGYASLRRWLEDNKPDVVAIGELTMYGHEGFRAFKMAREVNPDVVNIAGGYLYSALPDWTLEQCPSIDFVVRNEGEETLRELVETLRSGGDLSKVRGMNFRDGGRSVMNPTRPLIRNMDDLPIPAYDLSHLELYSPFGKLWPKAITVQRSRGCNFSCPYCSWWVQEGEEVIEGNHRMPRAAYRTKSVARMVKETELLYEKFGIRYLFWVDGTWNLDNDWLDEYCSELIKRKYDLGWWAFVRADLLVQQEKAGILEKMVRAGLRHVLVGIERANNEDLKYIDKVGYDRDITKEAFAILRTKYPEVFRQGTMLTGLWEDDKDSIRGLLKYAHEIDVDFPAFHPIMPFPGTVLYEQSVAAGRIEETDFSKFDMMVPVMPTKHMTREEVSEETTWCYSNFVAKKPLRFFSRLFSPHKIRRRLHWWFLYAIGRTLFVDLIKAIKGEKKFSGFASTSQMWRPKYYEK